MASGAGGGAGIAGAQGTDVVVVGGVTFSGEAVLIADEIPPLPRSSVAEARVPAEIALLITVAKVEGPLIPESMTPHPGTTSREAAAERDNWPSVVWTDGGGAEGKVKAAEARIPRAADSATSRVVMAQSQMGKLLWEYMIYVCIRKGLVVKLGIDLSYESERVVEVKKGNEGEDMIVIREGRMPQY